MIVNMSEQATEQEIDHIIQRITEAGFQPHITRGASRTIVAVVGNSGRRHEIEALRVAPGVEDVVPIAQPFKLVSRQTRPERTVVDILGVKIGGPDVVVIAGPCSVESREQMLSTAHAVKAAPLKWLPNCLLDPCALHSGQLSPAAVRALRSKDTFGVRFKL